MGNRCLKSYVYNCLYDFICLYILYSNTVSSLGATFIDRLREAALEGFNRQAKSQTSS